MEIVSTAARFEMRTLHEKLQPKMQSRDDAERTLEIIEAGISALEAEIGQWELARSFLELIADPAAESVSSSSA